MINKKNIWFLTLFSLILVLSIYYVTMPNDLLFTTNGLKNDEVKSENNEVQLDVDESTIFVALRVEEEENYLQELDNIKKILNDSTKSVEDKNDAYERMKNLNNNKSEQEKLESSIKKNFDLDSFVKIDGNQIRVVVDSKDHNVSLANKIMRNLQENYENDMHISVKFQSK